MDNFTSSQSSKEAYISVLKHKMNVAKGRRDTILQSINQIQDDDDDEEIEGEYNSNDIEGTAANEEFMKAYQNEIL